MKNLSKKIKSTPIGGPLYPPGPYKYPNVEGIIIFGNVKKTNASEVLPDPLKVGTGMSIIFINNYPDSTIGSYHEMVIFIPARLKKEYGIKMSGIFCPYIYVTSDKAFAAGREIWGFPKKMASFNFEKRENSVIGIVERHNKQILKISGEIQDELIVKQMESVMGSFGEVAVLTLKQFIDANCKEYILQQIIRTNMSMEPIKLSSLSNIKITAEESKADPIYKILPDKIVGGIYGNFNLFLPEGEVVLDFTKKAIKSISLD